MTASRLPSGESTGWLYRSRGPIDANRLALAVEQRQLTGVGLEDLGDHLGPLGRIPGQALRVGAAPGTAGQPPPPW